MPTPHASATSASRSRRSANWPSEARCTNGDDAYPLPIPPGVQGRLVLPEDLTAKGGERIATFVSALAFEDQLAIIAGES